MPQMAPLMWLIMFAVFILLSMITSTKMYFNSPKKNNLSINLNKKLIKTFMNWSW